MLDVLTNRQTIRKYSNQPISNDLLEKLLEATCRAPNTGNMQTYSIIITHDETKKKELSPCHFNQKMITEAPVVLTFCADFNRVNKWCEQRNAKPGYDNFLSFTSAMIDATIAAQHFCVAAESEGLGTCYLGTTTYTADKIIDILQLPKFVVPITTITIGYPDETPATKDDRLPLNGIVHYETYKDYSADDINQIYAYKENLESSKNFIEINKKETLAQIYTDIRYTKAANEQFSEVLIAVLKKQGFWKE
ncbi:MAG: nitroreductase family protein [Paludibacteraceae bacterium]|nr:nitroreductase family protein [Paludibacteraceae bacterium]